MARLALAFAAGIAWQQLGAPLPPAPLLLPLLLLPIRAFLRPRRSPGPPARAPGRGPRPPEPPGAHRPGAGILSGLAAAAAAGALLAGVHAARLPDDCRHRIPEGGVGRVAGRFLGRPGEGGVPFRLEATGTTGCGGPVVVRAYLDRDGEGEIRPGTRIRARGRWRRGRRPDPERPDRAGFLVLEDARPAAPASRAATPATAASDAAGPGAEAAGASAPDPTAGLLRLRGRLQARIARLYPERSGLVEALVLARKEGLDAEVREAFARAGVAHLLAISGFHVGVVAGLLLLAAGLAGVGPALRPTAAVAGVWAYVLGIGAPDAALRAAVILTLLALGRLRRRSVLPLGALSTALLALLALDPGALRRVGFQLSFAGTAGLVLWSRRLRDRLQRAFPRGMPSWLAGGLAAGTAATAATLPLVAWHFGRVSLVGIPMTLLVGPVVALALPGIGATVLLDPLHAGAAAFLAGGVELLLSGVVRGVEAVAALPGASVWTPESWVLLGCAAVVLVGLADRWTDGFGGGGRRALIGASVVSALVAAPVLTGLRGAATVEIVALDMGQGDALALRSPGGRWLLVDAGPRSDSWDAGARTVVPYLRRRGVGRLEALVLTHPDLDHVGGAGAVLSSLDVGGVLDPARATGRSAYGRALEAARERGVGWWPAGARPRLEVDGMSLTVLHPPVAGPAVRGPGGGAADTWSNDLSVVLLLEYGRFRALLTGDAPTAVEEDVLGRIDGPITVLKVGHHGSRTSTSRALLEDLRPRVAVIPVGRRNRYGHPHREVLERLTGAGVRILRTDRDGTVVVRGRRDGSWEIRRPDAR